MQSYVSNGLRALGRGAVVGAAIGALAAPVFGQKQLKEGIYDGKLGACDLSSLVNSTYVSCAASATNDGGKTTRRYTTMTKDGKLFYFAYTASDGEFKLYFVWDKPSDHTRNFLSRDGPEARDIAQFHEQVASDVLQPENCVSGPCKGK